MRVVEWWRRGEKGILHVYSDELADKRGKFLGQFMASPREPATSGVNGLVRK